MGPSSSGVNTSHLSNTPTNTQDLNSNDSVRVFGSRLVSKTEGQPIIQQSADGSVPHLSSEGANDLGQRDAVSLNADEIDGTSLEDQVEPDSESTLDSSPEIEADDTDDPVAEESDAGAETTRTSVAVESDFDARRQQFENELQPKLGFLDKHKKEFGSSIGGAAMLVLGAGLFAVFPPAGICVYAAGVAVLSMGLSKMLFTLDGESSPLPLPRPDQPENDDEAESSGRSEEPSGDDYFKAVGKPVLDALAGTTQTQPGEHSGDEHDGQQEPAGAHPENRLRSLVSGVNPDDLVADIQNGLSEGQAPSEVVSGALATVLASDKELDPSDERIYDALTPAIQSLESSLSSPEESASASSDQTKLEDDLRDASSVLMKQLSEGANGGEPVASPLTSAARQVAGLLSNLANEVQPVFARQKVLESDLSDATSVLMKQLSEGVNKEEPAASSLTDAAKQVAGSLSNLIEQIQSPTFSDEDYWPSSSDRGLSPLEPSSKPKVDEALTSNSFGAVKSQYNKVRFNTFAIEADRFFEEPSKRGNLTGSDKTELLEKARQIADGESGMNNPSPGKRLTQEQFYNELEQSVPEKLKSVVRDLRP